MGGGGGGGGGGGVGGGNSEWGYTSAFCSSPGYGIVVDADFFFFFF